MNFSVHTFCQFSCIYCNLNSKYANDKNTGDPYDFLTIAKTFVQKGLCDRDISIACAPGEIALHPNREEILDFAGKTSNNIMFHSNAGIYVEKIGSLLGKSKNNNLLTSLDCGTKETFHLVHGVNMFDQVIENIKKYRCYGENITLKYIILPGNNNDRDLIGFMDICERLDIKKISISYDLKKMNNDLIQEDEIINPAKRLAREAYRRGILFEITGFLGSTNTQRIIKELHEEGIEYKGLAG